MAPRILLVVQVVKMESGRVGRHLHVLSIELDAELDFLTVHLHGEKLSKGSVYRLSIEFVAQLNDQLKGFYRSSYDEDGVKKYESLYGPSLKRFSCLSYNTSDGKTRVHEKQQL